VHKERIPNSGVWEKKVGRLYVENYISGPHEIPDDVLLHSINIQLWDLDGSYYDWTSDDILDIDGHDSSKGLTVEYNILNGEWSGDDDDGITDGTDDGIDDYDVYLKYNIEKKYN
jgi:hypothetical protein